MGWRRRPAQAAARAASGWVKSGQIARTVSIPGFTVSPVRTFHTVVTGMPVRLQIARTSDHESFNSLWRRSSVDGISCCMPNSTAIGSLWATEFDRSDGIPALPWGHDRVPIQRSVAQHLPQAGYRRQQTGRPRPRSVGTSTAHRPRNASAHTATPRRTPLREHQKDCQGPRLQSNRAASRCSPPRRTKNWARIHPQFSAFATLTGSRCEPPATNSYSQNSSLGGLGERDD